MWLRVSRSEISINDCSQLPVELYHWNRKLRPGIPERVPWIFLTQFSWPEPFIGHKNLIPTHESSTSKLLHPRPDPTLSMAVIFWEGLIGSVDADKYHLSVASQYRMKTLGYLLRNPVPAIQNTIPLSVVTSTDKIREYALGQSRTMEYRVMSNRK